MKKVLSIILAFTFCFAAFSALAPSVSAESATISESEAKELIVKAYEFCRNVRADFSFIHEISDEYRIEVKFGDQIWDWEYYWLAKEENLPGGSYEKMCEYAETIYIKDVAPEAYAYVFTGIVHPSEGMWERLYPLFHRDENGVLYSASGVVMSYDGAYLYPDKENFEIEIVSGDSKTAKAVVPVYFHYIDGPRVDDFDLVECRFENTAEGWRIAESEYSLVMATAHAYLEDYRANNPDAPNPSGGRILLPDVREILLPVIASLDNDIDEYYCYDWCTDPPIERLYAGCMATTQKIGDEYVVTVKGDRSLTFVYDPENTVIEITETTDKEATALVYFGFVEGEKIIPKPIECKFSKDYSIWMLEDSQIIDLLTSQKSEEFTEADAKALIDAAVASRELLSNNYYRNHMVYVQGAPFELGYKIDWNEIEIPVEGQKYGELYITLMEHLLPGGSYEGFLDDTRSIFTESVAERYCTEYYYDNNMELFIIKDGERYINAHDVMVHLGFYYVPENGAVKLTEVSEDRAKALVYCQKKIEPENIDIVVECVFEKTADGWRIGDSEFADMIVSYHSFDYTVGEAPATGDNAFDTIAVCLGGMAIVMSVLCIVRKRREE